MGIVVMTRDRRERLVQTLQTLLALPGSPPVVVVDNGSVDGTVAAVRDAYPAVTVVPLARNIGAAARTKGACVLDTDYVAFADDDSWWAPEALDLAADLLDARQQVGLLAARVQVEPAGRLDPVSAAMAVSPLSAIDGLPTVLGFLACGAVVRRDAFLAVGGFHPLLGFLAEEHLLAVDLAEAGWLCAYADQVVAHHQPGGLDRGAGAARRRLQRRNELLTVLLRRPAPLAVRILIDQLLASLRSADEAAALAAALLRLPEALRCRRPVSRRTEASIALVAAAGE